MPDTGDGLGAVVCSGPALGGAYPAGSVFVLLAFAVPKKLHFNAPVFVGVNFLPLGAGYYGCLVGKGHAFFVRYGRHKAGHAGYGHKVGFILLPALARGLVLQHARLFAVVLGAHYPPAVIDLCVGVLADGYHIAWDHPGHVSFGLYPAGKGKLAQKLHVNELLAPGAVGFLPAFCGRGVKVGVAVLLKLHALWDRSFFGIGLVFFYFLVQAGLLKIPFAKNCGIGTGPLMQRNIGYNRGLRRLTRTGKVADGAASGAAGGAAEGAATGDIRAVFAVAEYELVVLLRVFKVEVNTLFFTQARDIK